MLAFVELPRLSPMPHGRIDSPVVPAACVPPVSDDKYPAPLVNTAVGAAPLICVTLILLVFAPAPAACVFRFNPENTTVPFPLRTRLLMLSAVDPVALELA